MIGPGGPAVLYLQETKVQDADFPAASFRDAGYYVVFWGQKAHAGVAIVSREKPQEVAFGLDVLRQAQDSHGGEPDEPRLIRAVITGPPGVNTYVSQGHSPDPEHFSTSWNGWLSCGL